MTNWFKFLLCSVRKNHDYFLTVDDILQNENVTIIFSDLTCKKCGYSLKVKTEASNMIIEVED